MKKFPSLRECKREMRTAYWELEQLLINVDPQERAVITNTICSFIDIHILAIKGANQTRVNELINRL